MPPPGCPRALLIEIVPRYAKTIGVNANSRPCLEKSKEQRMTVVVRVQGLFFLSHGKWIVKQEQCSPCENLGRKSNTDAMSKANTHEHVRNKDIRHPA